VGRKKNKVVRTNLETSEMNPLAYLSKTSKVSPARGGSEFMYDLNIKRMPDNLN
jgi:hypothetical protein